MHEKMKSFSSEINQLVSQHHYLHAKSKGLQRCFITQLVIKFCLPRNLVDRPRHGLRLHAVERAVPSHEVQVS